MEINLIKDIIYYFIKMLLFHKKVVRSNINCLSEILNSSISLPDEEIIYSTFEKNYEKFHYLKKFDKSKLYNSYKAVSLVRLSDYFLIKKLNAGNVLTHNRINNFNILKDKSDKQLVLILYGHTGSYYETVTALGCLGVEIYPISYDIKDGTKGKKVLEYFLNSMLAYSESKLNGGRYLYTSSGDLSNFLKEAIKSNRSSVLLSAIDISQSFITDKRMEVSFFDGKTSFPYKLVDLFLKRKLPIYVMFSKVEVIDGKIIRTADVKELYNGDGIFSVQEILSRYVLEFENLINESPEQLLVMPFIDNMYVNE